MSTPAGVEGSELVVHTKHPPVLCTGFEGSVASAAPHLFNLAEESDEAKGCLCGAALLTGEDESTKVPGVFLVGPSVSHGSLSFCFVYKFRQRFGVVANAICRRLGHDTTAAVEECKKIDMYLDDFGSCEGSCGGGGGSKTPSWLKFFVRCVPSVAPCLNLPSLPAEDHSCGKGGSC